MQIYEFLAIAVLAVCGAGAIGRVLQQLGPGSTRPLSRV
jgi:hypothetical protein